MRIKHQILALIIALFISSCSNESDITVTLKESGKLQIELTKNTDPVIGTMVYLLPEMNSDKSLNISSAIDMKETDVNGLVDFGEVNSGNYIIITEGVDVNGLIYNPSRLVQVVSGADKMYSIESTDYKGTITIEVLDYNRIPFSGVKVAIVPNEFMNSSNSVENSLKNAIVEKTTNKSGIVSFELPSGYCYNTIIYVKDINGGILNYDSEYVGCMNIGSDYFKTIFYYF